MSGKRSVRCVESGKGWGETTVDATDVRARSPERRGRGGRCNMYRGGTWRDREVQRSLSRASGESERLCQEARRGARDIDMHERARTCRRETRAVALS